MNYRSGKEMGKQLRKYKIEKKIEKLKKIRRTENKSKDNQKKMKQ